MKHMCISQWCGCGERTWPKYM